jgi:hypothetical protein
MMAVSRGTNSLTIAARSKGCSLATLQPEDYRDAVVPIETSDREYVSFRVTDNGSGMDAATQSESSILSTPRSFKDGDWASPRCSES